MTEQDNNTLPTPREGDAGPGRDGTAEALMAAFAAAGSTLLAAAGPRLNELARRLTDSVSRDITAVRQRDPAAHNTLEILTCYPGLHALWFYRLSHALWKRDIPVLPRLVSQFARFLTGVDIHPGATLGPGLFIDHASGVVIGETAEVGENVTIYQGVTLGGTGKETGKRHPTVGDNVVIGAGANLLGSIKIGDNVKIGSGSVVVRDAPDNSTVVGNPGRPVISEGARVGVPDIDYTHLPDPVAEAMKSLVRRVVHLENQIMQLRKTTADPAAADAWAPEALPQPDLWTTDVDGPSDPLRIDGTPDF